MKKLFLAVTALATAFALAPAAMAGSLCPGDAWQGSTGPDVGTFTPTGTCASTAPGTSVTMSVPNDNLDSAGLFWGSSNYGVTGLTTSNIASFNTTATFQGASTAQPYYIVDFHDNSNVFGEGEAASGNPDTIDLIENGSGNRLGGNMAFDPNATELAVFDNTTGRYLETGTKTLDGWLAQYPLLGNQPIYVGVEIGEGGSGVTASLTVTGADYTVTPEPSSLLLLGTGLLGMAGLLFRKKATKASSQRRLTASF